jgi:hypothetical protein
MSFGGGDAWLSTFEFFDNHDLVSNNQLFFPAYLFPHISQATMRSHC